MGQADALSAGGVRYPPAASSQSEPSTPAEFEVRAQLERIQGSADFEVPERARKFLNYVVGETLEGRADRIKAYSIALEVFGRDASFDAQNDPVVRIEAGRLRRALERYYLTAGRNDPIEISIPKGGYVPAFGSRLEVTEPETDTPATEAPSAIPRWSVPRWGWVGLAGLVIVAPALVWLGSEVASNASSELEPQAEPAIPRLLVEPLEDLNRTDESAIIAAGLTDEIIGQVAKFKEIAVVLPERSGAGRVSPETRYALSGSLRVSGESIRLAVRLVQVADRSVVWAEIYDERLEPGELVNVQADIAAQVANTLAQPFGIIQQSESRQVSATVPPSWEAYYCALTYYAYRADLGPTMHAKAQDCLQRTVEQFPSYATAWALLSLTYLDEVRFGFSIAPSGDEAIDHALFAAQRAVELDSNNVRGLEAQMVALAFDGQLEEALRLGDQARALNPNDSQLSAEYGIRLALSGEWKEGMDLILEVTEGNPGPRGYYATALAVGYYMIGDYETAAMWIERDSVPTNPIYRVVAAAIYGQLGRADDAQRQREWLESEAAWLIGGINEAMLIRNLRPKDRAHFIEGLRKAGLTVSGS